MALFWSNKQCSPFYHIPSACHRHQESRLKHPYPYHTVHKGMS